MTANKYVHFDSSVFFEISGIDKEKFLQALITNDINKCHHNKTIYSAFLTPQGKFIADFFIIEYQNNYLIEIHKYFFNEFINRLKIYKLRSNVEINEKNHLSSLVLIENYNLIKFENDFIKFNDPRSNNIGIKFFIPLDKINIFLDKYSLTKVSFDSYRELLIKNLIPFSPEDLIQNKSLLLENNFDKINAIDWDKGCYVGQEITARMKYRSLLKKSIRAVETLSGSLYSGNQIFNDKKNIGEIISCFKNYAIAMLKIEDANDAYSNKIILKTDSASLKIIG